jgi:hypothetical protein
LSVCKQNGVNSYYDKEGHSLMTVVFKLSVQ